MSLLLSWPRLLLEQHRPLLSLILPILIFPCQSVNIRKLLFWRILLAHGFSRNILIRFDFFWLRSYHPESNFEKNWFSDEFYWLMDFLEIFLYALHSFGSILNIRSEIKKKLLFLTNFIRSWIFSKYSQMLWTFPAQILPSGVKGLSQQNIRNANTVAAAAAAAAANRSQVNFDFWL